MDDLVGEAEALAVSRLTPLPRRLAHVRGVAAAAERVSAALHLDDGGELVAAAWLHDIGYAPSIRSTGFHPLDGAEFLRTQGWPIPIVALVAFHTGAIVEADERGLSDALSLLPQPSFNGLDLITYVDMITSPDGEPIEPSTRLAEILTRYAPEDLVHRAVSRSGPDLLAAVSRVQTRLDGAA